MLRGFDFRFRILLLLTTFLSQASILLADEGMWTFNNVPRQALKQRYSFEPAESWLAHLRLSSIRFNNGGSGSFVSANGLAMTNHHVAADCLQKLSSAGMDHYRLGFSAKSLDKEAKCPDLELNVLTDIEDVTERVNSVVNAGQDAAQNFAAQRGMMSTVENECAKATGLRCDVVTLYQGAMYNLYKYKKYTDVRLVFSPEFEIAFFGGDPDNFTFPRYDLDAAFLRVYENNKPASIQDYLKWNAAGPKEGDLVFVPGNPGRTARLDTLAELEGLRDRRIPFALDILSRRRSMLQEFSQQSEEADRMAKEDFFSVDNSLKAYKGQLDGLKDRSLMDRKAAEEKALRDSVAADPKKQEEYGKAWQAIADAQQEYGTFYREFSLIERGTAFNSQLFEIARMLVRLAAEKQKANKDRLREYRESNLASLELELFSPAPIYDRFEKAKLESSLQFMAEQLGVENNLVKKVLTGRSPNEYAASLVLNSQLKDVAVRKKLADGGQAAIEATDDAMIVLARRIDPEARALRLRYEDRVQGVEQANHALIAKALFAAKGTSVYPDATFTLRLAFGTVKGYQEDGKKIAPFTTIGGVYEHAAAHGGQSPYQLPRSWMDGKSRLNLKTFFNFVSTPDIIGGNSGSPVVDRQGQAVGLIFDGNIQSLVWDFFYDDTQGRAVAVDTPGILEALQKIYHEDRLVQELTQGHSVK
ncbi:MAG TPA: S46 family peptidase [Terriglobia bacterium]|nr:S46 family peptidase [Terriglobia bacterium]